MEETKLKNSLRSQILKISLVLLLLLTIIISAVSISAMYKSLVYQVRTEMERDASLVMLLYDEVYDGEFSFSQDENGGDVIIYKGSQKITGDDTMLDELSDMLGIEISLFYQDTRIMTTLKNANGEKTVGTKAAALVKRDALETGHAAFYNNVTVYDTTCFAYYKPLTADDGTVYGMIGVCRTSADVRTELLRNMWPIIIACLMTCAIVALIMVWYIKRITVRIGLMNKFMNTMANGNFDANMPAELMREDDEIKRLATDSKKMAKAIKNLVEYDALTGLINRRYGDIKLIDIKNRSDRTGTKYCVSIGDIDFFKKINDTYGHEMGDEILKAVANALQAGMRGNGIVARWGGEEFMFVYDDKDLNQAKEVAENILNSIRDIVIPNTDHHVTMSFGITEAADDESVDQILKRADDYLYEAKEAGRDRIVAK